MKAPFFIFVLLSGASVFAADSLYLELSGRGEKTALGLTDVAVGRPGPDTTNAVQDFQAVLKKDLEFTGLFSLVEGGPAGDGKRVKMDGWTRLGAAVVATGRWTGGGTGEFDGTLLDAGTGRAVFSKSLPWEEGGVRTAHRWADEIVSYFTGQTGVASTQIVFVNDATGRKEVYRTDYDGSHLRRLTNDRSIALFPKLSPTGEWIVFTSYRTGRPTVDVMRFDGSQRRVLCRYDGLNSAAAWMPDGKSLIVTLSMGREPNLYQVDLNGNILQTLTNSSAVDTAPTVSPDGLRVAFTSDRPGAPQIYAMDTTGANLQRWTSGGQCDSPVWSPLGHLVLFTMSVKGNFDIYSLEVATGRQNRLTYGEGNNENGTWSPDGRYVVFTSTRRGRPELWVMNADGSSPRLLGSLPGRSFTPHWGKSF
jgi:TolB protein